MQPIIYAFIFFAALTGYAGGGPPPKKPPPCTQAADGCKRSHRAPWVRVEFPPIHGICTPMNPTGRTPPGAVFWFERPRCDSNYELNVDSSQCGSEEQI